MHVCWNFWFLLITIWGSMSQLRYFLMLFSSFCASDQESAYWSANMNLYRFGTSGYGGTTFYTPYEVNNNIPRVDVSRRTWEYPSAISMESPIAVDAQIENNLVTGVDTVIEECQCLSLFVLSTFFVNLRMLTSYEQNHHLFLSMQEHNYHHKKTSKREVLHDDFIGLAMLYHILL